MVCFLDAKNLTLSNQVLNLELMKIAYITGEYPRATDTFIQREVAVLREKGVEVYTFSIRRTSDEHMVGPEQKLERQNTFYILPPNPLTLLKSHLNLLIRSPRRYLKGLKLAWTIRQDGFKGHLYQLFYFAEAGILAHQINRKQIQHLHNHLGSSSGSVAMLAAEMGGFTFSFTLHGSYIFFEPYRWRIDEKIKRALFVCCISYFCRSQGMFFAESEHWQRMYVIHCGIDPTLFTPVSHHKNSKKLLYVGRLANGKGLPLLLESLVTLKASHPDLMLTIVGDGSDRKNLELLAAQLGLKEKVKFVGSKSQTEVLQYLQKTDIFVLPSFSEGVPVVLMEAMAASIPVVATQVGGVSELVEDGVNGYLIPPGDTISLIKSIDNLLQDNRPRAKLGVNGRKKVEQEFNIYHEVERLYRVLKTAKEGKLEAIRPEI